jgi:hypothetical protein
MVRLNNKKIQISGAVVLIVIILILIGLWFKNDETIKTSQINPAETNPQGFTFFNIGANTKLTAQIRKQLRDQLGSDAVENRNPIDLEINYEGFLEAYFTDLYQLNKKLNDPPRQRVEHNTLKLRYRYTQSKNVSFDYVELEFSNFTQKPLLFKIITRKNGQEIIDAIRKKHGKPNTIKLEGDRGRTLYWEKNEDIFVISITKDRYGLVEYRIVIYFIDNIRELIQTEEANRSKEEERTRGGRKAF